MNLARLLRASDRAIREHVQWLESADASSVFRSHEQRKRAVAVLLEKAEELIRAAEAEETALTAESATEPEP